MAKSTPPDLTIARLRTWRESYRAFSDCWRTARDVDFRDECERSYSGDGWIG